MKRILLLGSLLLSLTCWAQPQSETLVGELRDGGQLHDLRFSADWEGSQLHNLSFEPHGYAPQFCADLKSDSSGYATMLQLREQLYRLRLQIDSTEDARQYRGTALRDAQQLPLNLTVYDAASAPGHNMRPSVADLRILDRAEELLGNGRGWCKECGDHCNTISYPFRWSLFCALHQANLEVDGRYFHYRPLMEAVRLAITEQYPEWPGEEAMARFNEEATDFSSVEAILFRSRELLSERIINAARTFSDTSVPPALRAQKAEEQL